MKIIGITGGIGAGKSAVLAYLAETCGAVVCEADKLAHRLQLPGEACHREITAHFGVEILHADGTIDRGKLGELVFADERELEFLNRLIHPRVREALLAAIRQEEQAEQENKGAQRLFLVEAALLFEAHCEEICDEVWYIYADTDTRIRRLVEGRGYTKEKCVRMMERQQPEEVFREKCSRVIDNSGSFADTKAQIQEIIKCME